MTRPAVVLALVLALVQTGCTAESDLGGSGSGTDAHGGVDVAPRVETDAPTDAAAMPDGDSAGPVDAGTDTGVGEDKAGDASKSHDASLPDTASPADVESADDSVDGVDPPVDFEVVEPGPLPEGCEENPPCWEWQSPDGPDVLVYQLELLTEETAFIPESLPPAIPRNGTMVFFRISWADSWNGDPREGTCGRHCWPKGIFTYVIDPKKDKAIFVLREPESSEAHQFFHPPGQTYECKFAPVEDVIPAPPCKWQMCPYSNKPWLYGGRCVILGKGEKYFSALDLYLGGTAEHEAWMSSLDKSHYPLLKVGPPVEDPTGRSDKYYPAIWLPLP